MSDPNSQSKRRQGLAIEHTAKQGAGIIFLNSANEVLLFLRDDKPELPYPNRWDLLGGGLEPGETPEECIAREIREEIEYDLRSAARYKTLNIPEGTAYIFWQHAEFDLAKTPLHEGQKLRWFSEIELQAMAPDEIAFGFREVLLEFFRGPRCSGVRPSSGAASPKA